MPIHDYHCPDCGRTSELLVRSSGPEPACLHCGGVGLQRLVSAPAPPATHRAVMASARRAAAREGHLSHCAPAERPHRLR